MINNVFLTENMRMRTSWADLITDFMNLLTSVVLTAVSENSWH